MTQAELLETEARYRQILAARPDSAGTLFDLAGVLRITARGQEAASAYRRVNMLKPDFADGFAQLGITLAQIGEQKQAIAALKRACELQPLEATYPFLLGNVLQSQGDLENAAIAFQTAATLRPDHLWARSNLGDVLRQLGRIESAIASYDSALAIQPDFIPALSGRLYALHYDPRYSDQDVYREHLQSAARICDSVRPEPAPADIDRRPDRTLRVGYVSPDLRGHSVAFFIESLFANHDPDQVDLFCYADLPKSDSITERLRKSVPHWRDITGLDDQHVCRLIHQDRIDILVDLAGHTANNRLALFARKPAPIQVTYLGYPDTTGLRTIDYRLTDDRVDPQNGTDGFYSEKLVRLPGSFAVYRPPAANSEIGPLPAIGNGFVTFANFNGLAKMSAAALNTWGKILAALPCSRMVIAATGLQSENTRAEILGTFARSGIDAGRLTLLPQQPMSRYLALHNEVDISLDSFPVQGHTVTCHSLWLGVPVICLAGRTCAQRLAASVLGHLNLPELIAQSEEEYVKIAVDLAADGNRLAALRGDLRRRMQQSPIMQGRRLAENVEAAYQRMWRDWCNAD
jgi:protein O-GlcNAc transferase